MTRALTIFGALALCAALAAPAFASDCSGNFWQPTFVHDRENEDGPWFVTPSGTFTKLDGATAAEWVPQACSLIQSSGLRDQRGFTDCQNYTRVQCGCSRADTSNTTCAAFLAMHGGGTTTGSTTVPGGNPDHCSTNFWMPTFVHDRENEDGPWFVMPDGTFHKLAGTTAAEWIPQACSLIQSSGLRDQRGFTDCQNYTRVQCGCSRSDTSNSTCAAFLAMHPGAATGAMSALEVSIDRPGSDYTSFDLSSPDPAACQKACADDARCVAFTYVIPGHQGPSARCWLKDSVPDQVPNDCCTSGVKQ